MSRELAKSAADRARAFLREAERAVKHYGPFTGRREYSRCLLLAQFYTRRARKFLDQAQGVDHAALV